MINNKVYNMGMLCVQVLQQELEALKREKPALTPRPARQLAPIQAYVDNDKVSHHAMFDLSPPLPLAPCPVPPTSTLLVQSLPYLFMHSHLDVVCLNSDLNSRFTSVSTWSFHVVYFPCV